METDKVDGRMWGKPMVEWQARNGLSGRKSSDFLDFVVGALLRVSKPIPSGHVPKP